MVLAIRDVEKSDLDAVLALNNGSDSGISHMTADGLSRFFDVADYFRVALSDDQLVGFLIALRETARRDDASFDWFYQRYERFMYINRVVVANDYRRHGLGRVFYADVESFAEPRVPMLTCAVTLEPRDDAAVLFHGTYGFHEVGQRVSADDRRIGLLSKDLVSHAFIRRHYGGEDKLPQVPWLAGRLPGFGDKPTSSSSSTGPLD